MYTPSAALQLLLRQLTLQSSWEAWCRRNEQSIDTAVIRFDRPIHNTLHNTICDARPRTAVIVYRRGATQHTEVMTCPSQTPVSVLALDAFEWLYRRAAEGLSRTSVFIDHSGVRNELIAVSDSFPCVRIVNLPTGVLQPMLISAGERLPEPAAPAVQPTVNPRKIAALAVGTDASKRYRHNGVGIGAVDAEGIVHTAWLPALTDINVGEVLAIALAVNQHHGRRLSIVTDSRVALKYLQLPLDDLYTHMDVIYACRVVALQRALERTGSQVRWVPGHSGHALNEAAHRAAVAARRNAEFDVSEDVAAQMYRSIGDDVLRGDQLLMAG